jgi:N-acetylmuramoyl-L-alanine amidase
MEFKNGILDGVDFAQANHVGGKITPILVVLHDTAGRLDFDGVARYLRDNKPKVSVHFVIGVEGELQQQVPVDRRANHAGKSTYHGQKRCNNFSIGIELVNPGRMIKISNKVAQAWFGQKFLVDKLGIVERTTPEHGHGMWMPYEEAQLNTLMLLLCWLFDGVPSLKDIRPHWYVSPGRKTDTNPLFPLDEVRAQILGRDDPSDIEAEDGSSSISSERVEILTNGESLNMRRWPSFNPNVIGSIPNGTLVDVLRYGTFDGREWMLVEYGGLEGWIVGRFTKDKG